jgi:hypothetical protein
VKGVTPAMRRQKLNNLVMVMKQILCFHVIVVADSSRCGWWVFRARPYCHGEKKSNTDMFQFYAWFCFQQFSYVSRTSC